MAEVLTAHIIIKVNRLGGTDMNEYWEMPLHFDGGESDSPQLKCYVSTAEPLDGGLPPEDESVVASCDFLQAPDEVRDAFTDALQDIGSTYKSIKSSDDSSSNGRDVETEPPTES